MVKTGSKARGLPKVAAELDDRYATVHRGNFAQQRKGAVVGAVIHQDHLKGFAAGLHYGLQAGVQIGDILLFVVERYYD